MIEPFTTAVSGNLTTISAVMLAYLAGSMTPVYYAQERMRGFGRAMASRLPYQPPPRRRGRTGDGTGDRQRGQYMNRDHDCRQMSKSEANKHAKIALGVDPDE
jgi:hypothetical protein